MTRKIFNFLVGAGALALSACADGTQFGDGFNEEAGAFLDEGGFGNPTMNNTLIQNGDQNFLANLNQRFGAEVPTMVTFEFDKAFLDEDAKAILRQQANWIRQFPEIRFRVYGYTDAVGSNSYNESLGHRRAEAVVRYLGTQGISRSRLEALVSYGETRLAVDTSDRERRNRRAVTEVSGVVANHPSVLNGKYAEVIWREYVSSASPSGAIEGGGVAAIEGGG